ncbi:MAG: DNA-formamidopyrimidine glycosylase [Anaerolineales bacterium]|nr:DNA-formamidopyrimidine glycosylase [Anaerolineales bacterium]
MPELPEVETIARHLRLGHQGAPALPGQSIAEVSVRWPRHIAEPSPGVFRRRIRGQTIQTVLRRGKYLVLPLSDTCLLIHLKMSGDLGLARAGSEPGRFDRTVLHLQSGWELRFSDSRKFGRLFLVADPSSRLGRLGPDPLDDAFTSEILHARLLARRRRLKPLLLDQGFVAGLGNIYTDEALHVARLHPLLPSHLLGTEDAHRLWAGIRETLNEGLRRNGASIDWVYRGGEYQNHFRVYQQTGKPCPVCGTPIQRIPVAQRSSHYCPRCQPEPRGVG